MPNLLIKLGITMLIVTHAREVAEQTNKIVNFKDGLISSIEDIKQL